MGGDFRPAGSCKWEPGVTARGLSDNATPLSAMFPSFTKHVLYELLLALPLHQSDSIGVTLHGSCMYDFAWQLHEQR